MRHHRFVLVLLTLAAAAGYLTGSHPLKAQSEPWPVTSGELVTLSFPGGSSRPCAIEEIKGSFARCGTSQRQPSGIGQRERPEEWVNLAQVEWVMKPRQER